MSSSPPRQRRTASLRVALVLRTVVPLFVVLGGATALTLVTLEREVEDRMKEDVELVARGLQLPLTHALEEDRWEAVSQALQSALEIRRFYGAHVYGPGGGRLASFGAGLPDEPPQRLAELAETGDRVGEYGETAGRRVYSYFVPLVDTWGQTLGILQITRRRRDIDESIQRLRFRTGSLFLLGMALVTVLVLRGHHRAVGGPLDGLRASMARVREGDRTHRATMAGPRELAEVTGTFNSMLETMQQAEEELESRRRAQAGLRRELAEAEKLAAVGELAGGVAHELGSPLSVIDGKAQRLLRDDGATPKMRASLEGVRREVRRMEGIIRQLLDFGRRDTGRSRGVALDEVVRFDELGEFRPLRTAPSLRAGWVAGNSPYVVQRQAFQLAEGKRYLIQPGVLMETPGQAYEARIYSRLEIYVRKVGGQCSPDILVQGMGRLETKKIRDDYMESLPARKPDSGKMFRYIIGQNHL
jgi:two-component system, NtrC family, sensor kinase